MKGSLVDDFCGAVKETLEAHLSEQSVSDLASLTWIQGQAQELAGLLNRCVFEVWKTAMEAVCMQLGRICPGCGNQRRCKWRKKDPMVVEVLGLRLEVPKPYLECAHCNTPGVSIMRLLTGLSSGDASMQLELMAAYSAAQHSYAKATQDLEVHHGQQVERTKLRRMALDIEQQAMEFAERERREALQQAGQEITGEGVPALMVEADGGKIRTGTLVSCEPGDPGYGEKTSYGTPKRKRPTQWRELITMDTRPPGASSPSALDVLLPVLSKVGERSRRMLTCGVRSGLGGNTRVYGLGDMGSSLASAFEEAYVGHEASWSADWKHTRDYVEAAGKVLTKAIDVDVWKRAVIDAIWKRNAKRRDELCAQAKRHRVRRLPAQFEKCPVAALATYLENNWKHMRFAERKELGLPIVSARAESQVRDRTKDRFSVAGAWLLTNIEPKATLRAIIAEGRWEAFRRQQIQKSQSAFEEGLRRRLQQAVARGSLCKDRVAEMTGLPLSPSAAANAQQPTRCAA